MLIPGPLKLAHDPQGVYGPWFKNSLGYSQHVCFSFSGNLS